MARKEASLNDAPHKKTSFENTMTFDSRYALVTKLIAIKYLLDQNKYFCNLLFKLFA